MKTPSQSLEIELQRSEGADPVMREAFATSDVQNSIRKLSRGVTELQAAQDEDLVLVVRGLAKKTPIWFRDHRKRLQRVETQLASSGAIEFCFDTEADRRDLFPAWNYIHLAFIVCSHLSK